MPDLSKIHLQRYPDGTPSVLRKKTVYTDLYFYRKSDVLVQLTKTFCERFLPKYGDRTVDQMVQAARSVKQNIAEGLTDGQTSFETEIKLLGIAKGSNQELLEDYLDYVKQHHLNDWAKFAGKASQASQASYSREASYSSQSSQSSDSRSASYSRQASLARSASLASNPSNPSNPSLASHPSPPSPASLAVRYDKLLAYCRTHNDLHDYEQFFTRWTDEEMANTAICLCHMVDKMMASFIRSKDNEFVEEGGIRERMTAARLDKRGTQKEIISQQNDELASLRSQVASLQRELTNARGIPAN